MEKIDNEERSKNLLNSREHKEVNTATNLNMTFKPVQVIEQYSLYIIVNSDHFMTMKSYLEITKFPFTQQISQVMPNEPLVKKTDINLTKISEYKEI